jgi:hypothetical protein
MIKNIHLEVNKISNTYAFGKYNKFVYKLFIEDREYTHTLFYTNELTNDKIIDNVFKHHSKDMNMSAIKNNIVIYK